MPPLQLNCLVLEDDPDYVFFYNHNDVFSVKIADTASVGGLIETVNKHVFQHVDAECLALWNVSIPGDINFEEKINNLDLANKEPLPHVLKLSEVFPDPPEEEHLHIIVRSPPAGECQGLWPFLSVTHRGL